jgi:hypothetical protein
MAWRLLRRKGLATFAFLVVLAELCGRSITTRVDARLHVRPLANSGADYYPALLVGAKIAAALALAALLARLTRAHAAADAGDRLLTALGHPHAPRPPRLRPRLSFRIWFASFAATSLVYLLHADADGIAAGRWPLLAPWLHTYALPVFAVLSVAVAFAWRCARWLHAVEAYARQTLERVRRILHGTLGTVTSHGFSADDTKPRRRFGVAFESRPPPLPA